MDRRKWQNSMVSVFLVIFAAIIIVILIGNKIQENSGSKKETAQLQTQQQSKPQAATSTPMAPVIASLLPLQMYMGKEVSYFTIERKRGCALLHLTFSDKKTFDYQLEKNMEFAVIKDEAVEVWGCSFSYYCINTDCFRDKEDWQSAEGGVSGKLGLEPYKLPDRPWTTRIIIAPRSITKGKIA